MKACLAPIISCSTCPMSIHPFRHCGQFEIGCPSQKLKHRKLRQSLTFCDPVQRFKRMVDSSNSWKPDPVFSSSRFINFVRFYPPRFRSLLNVEPFDYTLFMCHLSFCLRRTPNFTPNPSTFTIMQPISSGSSLALIADVSIAALFICTWSVSFPVLGPEPIPCLGLKTHFRPIAAHILLHKLSRLSPSVVLVVALLDDDHAQKSERSHTRWEAVD